MAKISVFGLGYVGVVSAACFSSNGHEVIGVDINQDKVDFISAGQSPIIEKDLGDLLAKGAASGRIRGTSDPAEAVRESDISIICVGTPSHDNGDLNVTAVDVVCRQIGAAIASKDSKHIVVIRSTILPGAMENVVTPALEEASGGKRGEAFDIAHNPEFLREGTAVYDFFNPPKTVVGAYDQGAGETVAALYDGIEAPLTITSVEISEMVKYVDNVWHALKVCFGNEIGNIAKAMDIDSHKVMEIFFQDTKLNLSPYYLKPGFAFGGSCLPKDTRALIYRAKELDLNLPVLNNIVASNQQQIDRAVRLIMNHGKKKVSVLGFSFKADTDDLRESPLVEVIERLLGKGYDIKLYDSNVSLAALTGANKDYILNVIPHVSSLLVDSMDEALAHGELVIVGNGAEEFEQAPARLTDEQTLIDFVRLKNASQLGDRYEGINWEIKPEQNGADQAHSDDRGELAGSV